MPEEDGVPRHLCVSTSVPTNAHGALGKVFTGVPGLQPRAQSVGPETKTGCPCIVSLEGIQLFSFNVRTQYNIFSAI